MPPTSIDTSSSICNPKSRFTGTPCRRLICDVENVKSRETNRSQAHNPKLPVDRRRQNFGDAVGVMTKRWETPYGCMCEEA